MECNIYSTVLSFIRGIRSWHISNVAQQGADVKPTKSFTVGLSLSVEKNSNNHAYGTAYVPETIKIGENLYKVSDGVRHVSTWTSQVANVSNSKYITYILQK